MCRRTVHVLAVFGVIFALSLMAAAQTTSGRLRGRAQDPDGVPIPGVTITPYG